MVAITIRNIPDDVRNELAARAARKGRSLQEFLRGMLIQTAATPAVDDVIARARAQAVASGVHLDAAAILEAKDADRQ